MDHWGYEEGAFFDDDLEDAGALHEAGGDHGFLTKAAQEAARFLEYEMFFGSYADEEESEPPTQILELSPEQIETVRAHFAAQGHQLSDAQVLEICRAALQWLADLSGSPPDDESD